MKDCFIETAFFKEAVHQMCAAKINIREVTPNEGRVACDGVT